MRCAAGGRGRGAAAAMRGELGRGAMLGRRITQSSRASGTNGSIVALDEREAARATRCAREELRLRPALLAWERARLRLGASWVSGEPVVEKRPAERAGEPAFARLARAFDLWCAFSADDDAPPRECDSQPPPGTSYCMPCRMPEDDGGAAAGCCGAAAGHGYDGCSCESSRAPRGYRGDDQQLMMPDDG